MAVGVVDGLEVVEVEHDQPERMVIAPNLLDLGGQQLLEAAVVGQPGQLIGDRLAADLVVQLDVLQRQRGLAGQRAQQVGARPR